MSLSRYSSVLDALCGRHSIVLYRTVLRLDLHALLQILRTSHMLLLPTVLFPTASVPLQINEPLLFLISGRDELVPPAQMRMLYSRASRNSEGNAKVVEFPEGGHMDLWVRAGERYWRTVQIFVQECTS